MYGSLCQLIFYVICLLICLVNLFSGSFASLFIYRSKYASMTLLFTCHFNFKSPHFRTIYWLINYSRFFWLFFSFFFEHMCFFFSLFLTLNSRIGPFSNDVSPFPHCYHLSLLFLTRLPLFHHPKSEKPFLRKENYKTYSRRH